MNRYIFYGKMSAKLLKLDAKDLSYRHPKTNNSLLQLYDPTRWAFLGAVLNSGDFIPHSLRQLAHRWYFNVLSLVLDARDGCHYGSRSGTESFQQSIVIGCFLQFAHGNVPFGDVKVAPGAGQVQDARTCDSR